jgi:glycosyltransferase involved in cell wall biosynthesis
MNKAKDGNLKILIVFNSLMGGLGGASRHMLEVAKYWHDSNDIDILISESGYNTMKIHFPDYSGKVILYSTPFDNSKNRILVYTSRIIKNILIAPHINANYDVIIAPNYLPQNMIPSIFLRGKGAKLVVYFHTVQPELRLSYLNKMNFIRRYISILNWELCVFLSKSYFDLLFVVNIPTKEYFLKRGFSSEKVLVVDNAISYKDIINSYIEEKTYDGVFLSRLVERKGIWDLIPIWKKIVENIPSARLCVIGSGPEMERLKSKIEEENLSKNITLMGEVSDKKKFELLSSSKIFVFPSYYESWGIVIAEAIACGLHVVAYDLSIYHEIFNGNICTVKMGNVNEMSEKVIKFLTHPQDYEQKLEQAKRFISKFDWEVVAKKELSNIKATVSK